MLKSIKIQNLGCFNETPSMINFDNLTVMVGPNNSGKSTFFKALNFLKSVSHGKLLWSSDSYHLASFEDSVYSHDVERNIVIDATYNDDSDQFQAHLEINRGQVFASDFFKNGARLDDLSHEKHRGLLSQIWYFSPIRIAIPYQTATSIASGNQPLFSNGGNIIQYLLEQWSDQNPQWNELAEWLKKIDSKIDLLKTPVNLSSGTVQAATIRNDGQTVVDINLSLQGSGIQTIATILASVIFSPKNSTVIIEEPENFLHPNAIENLIDLFNEKIRSDHKQIILTTHSTSIIANYSNEIKGTVRRTPHIPTDLEHLRLVGISGNLGLGKIILFDPSKYNSGDLWHFYTEELG